MTLKLRRTGPSAKKRIATRRAIRDLNPKTHTIRGGQANIDPLCLPVTKRP